MGKIFSIPLNPKLTPTQYEEFVNFVNDYKHLIYDVYFTSRIPPFEQDAMGDVFVIKEDYSYAIQAALNIQNLLGVPISATFNNIQVPPTQKNLDTFIYNFKPLYDAGVKIATIPHTHWMATGQIKKVFPDIFVKNTILRDVRTATEIVNLAKYGFDYINLDRDLMRDRDALIRITQAKQWIKKNLGKEIKISLLANEGCLGNCPMMVEHFEFNNNRKGNSPQYFNDPISRVSCPKWDHEDPAIQLKTADLPPWKADWQEFINDLGIDVFKMHGREAVSRLYETMDIIKRWDRNEELLNDKFSRYLEETHLKEKPINIWREKIKNCKFDCWECQYCDKIYKSKSPLYHSELVKHVVSAVEKSGIPTTNINVPGLTSPRVQTLLNNLAQGVDTYLEIGSYLGATACAVLKNNFITLTAVDKWVEQIQSQDGTVKDENNLKTFLDNIKKYQGSSTVNIINSDLFDVDISVMHGSIKMFFYDGPHNEETTKKAVEYYWPTLADESILVFDDANWEGVVKGARDGINLCNGIVLYEKMMLNSEENKAEWWNGVYVLVVRK
jgi:predicted O-methyltransferase YrrM